jgi:hypothetical protein
MGLKNAIFPIVSFAGPAAAGEQTHVHSKAEDVERTLPEEMGGSTHQEEQHRLGAPNAGGTETAWEGMVPAAVLAHFRRSGRGAVDGEWRCSLCLVTWVLGF